MAHDSRIGNIARCRSTDGIGSGTHESVQSRRKHLSATVPRSSFPPVESAGGARQARRGWGDTCAALLRPAIWIQVC